MEIRRAGVEPREAYASLNIHCHGEMCREGGVLEVTVAMPRGLKRLLLEFMCFTRAEGG